MRVLRIVLFSALTSGIAFAGSKVPLRVVRVMPETHQALLYDKTAGTHVLVELGKTIDGFTVEDIDEDEVTLVGDGGAQVVLAAPDTHRRADAKKSEDKDAKGADVKDGADGAKDAPQDPYAAPQDPYAEPVRVVEAPAPTATPVTVAIAPPTTPPTTVVSAVAPAPTAPAAPTTTPAAPTPTTSAAPAPPAPAPTVAVVTPAPDSAAWTSGSEPAAPILARADVRAALANFAKLATSIHGSFTPDGARLDAVAPDSLFAKAGLHIGDVIASVDGQPLRSLDDAASLYARAPGVKSLTLAVIRAGKPLSLRVVIQ
jgi:membrane-associated protease RseP (regulator of RpoE activity)